jgi:IclR family transcriptional regulator, acetate operon repressor
VPFHIISSYEYRFIITNKDFDLSLQLVPIRGIYPMADKAEGTASLEKALDVLDAIGMSVDGMSQVELAERLSLPRTTLYRLLASLTARGLIRRDPSRRVYCLGFKCFEFARHAHAIPDLAAAAAIELRSLRDITGETSYLAILDGSEVFSIERVDGAHSQRSNSALGERKPLHCTSQGKAILSALPDALRDKLIKAMPLKALTPHTITDRRRLLSELKITSARGYSIDDEEIVLNVRCVGAPVIDSAGQVRGAISVAGPAWRMTRERLEILGPEIVDAARRVGAQLMAQKPTTEMGEAMPVDGPWAFYGAYPCWSQRSETLYWADTLAPTLRAYKDGLDREVMRFDHPITGLAILPSETLLVCFEKGFQTIPLPLGEATPLSELNSWFSLPPSAVCSGPKGEVYACLASDDGRFIVGHWKHSSQNIAANNRENFAPSWSLNQPLNHLAWSQDGQRLYGVNSIRGELVVMTLGQPSVRRIANIPKGSGIACGLAVDQSGGIWTALKDGWSIIRLNEDGSIEKVVSLPVPTPSDLAISKVNGETRIFVTSARQSLSAEAVAAAPLAGSLFSVLLKS